MFSMKVLRDDVSDMILQDVESLVQILNDSNGEEIDVQKLFFKFTFDTICQVAFGLRPHALNKENVPVLDAFDRCQERLFERFFVNPRIWKAMRFFGLGKEKRFAEDLKLIQKYTEDVIKQRMEVDHEAIRKHPDLLSQHIIHARDHDLDMSSTQFRDVVCW